jgi:hypothetical protein
MLFFQDDVAVDVEGPTEIPQGEWKSYKIKIYLPSSKKLTSCQFKLTIEQMEGNELIDQVNKYLFL